MKGNVISFLCLKTIIYGYVVQSNRITGSSQIMEVNEVKDQLIQLNVLYAPIICSHVSLTGNTLPGFDRYDGIPTPIAINVSFCLA